MVQLNQSRVNFLEKFERLIDEYNAASYNLYAFFNELLAFTQALNEEEQRGLRENLTEEELAIFDVLTQPDPALSDGETREVKKIAKELPAKLKAGLLVIEWRTNNKHGLLFIEQFVRRLVRFQLRILLILSV